MCSKEQLLIFGKKFFEVIGGNNEICEGSYLKVRIFFIWFGTTCISLEITRSQRFKN